MLVRERGISKSFEEDLKWLGAVWDSNWVDNDKN
jgi:hypothetical protein